MQSESSNSTRATYRPKYHEMLKVFNILSLPVLINDEGRWVTVSAFGRRGCTTACTERLQQKKITKLVRDVLIFAINNKKS